MTDFRSLSETEVPQKPFSKALENLENILKVASTLRSLDDDPVPGDLTVAFDGLISYEMADMIQSLRSEFPAANVEQYVTRMVRARIQLKDRDNQQFSRTMDILIDDLASGSKEESTGATATGHLTLPRSWVVPVAFCKYGMVPGFEDDGEEWDHVKFAYDSTSETFRVLEDGHVVHHTLRGQGPIIVLAPSEDPRHVRLILVRHGDHAHWDFWDVKLETTHHRQVLLVHLMNMGSTIAQRAE
ncbi:MAG: hypothetical protein Q9208_008806, partial [Pyrenodesmia sp. 3 TL-2023]